MERATNNIKDPKAKAYFEDVANGKEPTEKLSADDYEKGLDQFLDGMNKALDEADELIFRSKLGDVPEYISFSYIAKKYFGKSRAWLMQKVNGNTVHGKQAAFTDTERKQFREALQDISKKLSSVATLL